jgi:hypothetical protein
LNNDAGWAQLAHRGLLIWEMRALNCTREELRNAAAVKIQNMLRRAMGQAFLAREKVRRF